MINLLMSDAIPITIRYSLKLDVKAIIQHKRDLDPLLPLKNVRCSFIFFFEFTNDWRCIHHIVKKSIVRRLLERVNDFVSMNIIMQLVLRYKTVHWQIG